MVSHYFFSGPGIHYHKRVSFVWANHHGRGKNLATTKNHNLFLVDQARLLVAKPFFQNRNPAKIAVSGIHVLRFVFLEDFPVLFFKMYVFFM